MGSQNQLNGGHQTTCCVSAQRLQNIMSHKPSCPNTGLGQPKNKKTRNGGRSVSRVCRACVARASRVMTGRAMFWNCTGVALWVQFKAIWQVLQRNVFYVHITLNQMCHHPKPTLNPILTPTLNLTLNPTLNPILNPILNLTLNLTLNLILNLTLNLILNPILRLGFRRRSWNSASRCRAARSCP